MAAPQLAVVRRVFTFPDIVNEVSARLVATGVVAMSAIVLVGQQPWLIAIMAYGFVARVSSGPTLSPLGQLVTRVITPLLPIAEKPTAGAPKRFAQAIGATLSVAAALAHFALSATTLAYVLVAMIAIAASMEAFIGFCLGCWLFAKLIALGILPESVCEDCADISQRLAASVNAGSLADTGQSLATDQPLALN